MLFNVMPGILRVKYVSSFFILKSEQNRKLQAQKDFCIKQSFLYYFMLFYMCRFMHPHTWGISFIGFFLILTS